MRYEIEIEQATANDVSAVCEIDRLASGDSRKREALIEVINSGQCLVARIGNKHAGFAILDRTLLRQFTISLLVVHPDYHSMGVGPALIRYVESLSPHDRRFLSRDECDALLRRLYEMMRMSEE